MVYLAQNNIKSKREREVKSQFIKGVIATGVVALTACGIKDAVEDAVADVSSEMNSTLAEASRTVDGLLEDQDLRDSAMTLLKAVMPDSIAVSSVLNGDLDQEGYSSKISRLDSVLSRASRESDPIRGVQGCLRALPRNLKQWQSPQCYGPSLAYDPEEHPDKNGIPAMGNQLPSGDLGIWEELHNDKQACAAAKLNQLSRNTAIYSDLATGSLAMMVCVSAFAGDTLPGPGNILDVMPIINKVQEKAKFRSQGMDLEVATIKNNDGLFEISLSGVFFDKKFSVNTAHDPSENSGVISVVSENHHGDENATNQNQEPQDTNLQPRDPMNEAPKPVQLDETLKPAPLLAMGDPNCQPYNGQRVGWRVASLKYSRVAGETSYRMINSAQESESDAKSAIQASGEVSTNCDDFIGDLNIVQATQSVGSGEMAFGWQAGSGDGYLRVFNATTSGDQGTAWFGYSPHETETVSELLTIDRMICNWAGVGSQRSGQQFLQMQEMQLAEGIWAPTQSKISYAPTNSCSMDEADQEDVFPTVDWDITQHDLAPMSDYTFSVPRL